MITQTVWSLCSGALGTSRIRGVRAVPRPLNTRNILSHHNAVYRFFRMKCGVSRFSETEVGELIDDRGVLAPPSYGRGCRICLDQLDDVMDMNACLEPQHTIGSRPELLAGTVELFRDQHEIIGIGSANLREFLVEIFGRPEANDLEEHPSPIRVFDGEIG